eukprot:CAMPEP_0172542468 /NCGR_PEP_ID=MMETSP1067-20121228/13075_1 /TAXON_ID=265564 ORGANISM="Thalassiosira punctigera, Strain Tpunct2005C2" /NCGR_SAMPLE_ID=MMETSP1067 /ASSEMBLY_ACC=CAM_ASM_000444 /LENGTH=632 /DNA_ID=CAMNT_0013328719 /DNA_START=45 /DNA_END=1943 /DNA_ORIENTATION=+
MADQQAVAAADGAPSHPLADKHIDHSAGAYSRKKLDELEAIRAERARRQNDSVPSIVERMNERGIGRVNLSNVQVEAFVHPNDHERKRKLELEAYAAALKNVHDEALKEAEKEVVGELMEENDLEDGRLLGGAVNYNKFRRGNDLGGGGTGGGIPSKSINNYLEQAYRSAGGGGGTSRSSVERSPERGVDATEGGPQLYAQPSPLSGGGSKGGNATKFWGEAKTGAKREEEGETAPISALGRTGGVVGVYRDKIANTTASSKAGGSKKWEVPSQDEIPGKKADLVSKYDRIGAEVSVGGMHAAAYSMNASKCDSSFKQRGTGMESVGGSEAPQKDRNEVVADMAEARGKAQDPGGGDVSVPGMDEGAYEYERVLKARLSIAKENTGPVLNVPMMKVSDAAAMTPHKYHQQMRTRLMKDGAGEGAMVERVVVECDDNDDDEDSNYVGEVTALDESHDGEDVTSEKEQEKSVVTVEGRTGPEEAASEELKTNASAERKERAVEAGKEEEGQSAAEVKRRQAEEEAATRWAEEEEEATWRNVEAAGKKEEEALKKKQGEAGDTAASAAEKEKLISDQTEEEIAKQMLGVTEVELPPAIIASVESKEVKNDGVAPKTKPMGEETQADGGGCGCVVS